MLFVITPLSINTYLVTRSEQVDGRRIDNDSLPCIEIQYKQTLPRNLNHDSLNKHV